MTNTGYDMLYLATCALNGIVPDKGKIKQMDLRNLFQMCQFHCLTAVVDIALESAGIENEQFLEAESKAVKKNLMLDMEREKICGFMERKHILHMPLKGTVLKDLYPKTGMRQMADNDILYDKNYQRQVMEFMTSNGYTAKSVGKGNHDIYIKPPIFNFELHTALFGKCHGEKLYNYYKDVRNRLVKDEGKDYSYHFTDEDCYVYITAHEYKHYSGGGTGLRSLADCYVYLKAKSNSMNWDYISNQLEKLGIADFEKKSRSLAEKVFSDPMLPKFSNEETEMLVFYLFSGTYGTIENHVKSGIKKNGGSKLKYLLRRVFPTMDFYRDNYPFVYKSKILIPFFCVYRIIRATILRHKNIYAEFKTVKKFKV